MKPLELALAARLPGTQVWVTERREQGLNDLSRPTPRRTPISNSTRSWPLHDARGPGFSRFADPTGNGSVTTRCMPTQAETCISRQ
jgi:hypothetical protein